MADANDDVQSEITPEDFDGKQETPQAESSPAKEAPAEKPEGKDAKADKETPTPPDVPTKDKESDTEEPDKPEEPVDADKPEDKPTKLEQREAKLKAGIEADKKALGISPNVAIRDLVSARNALKAEVEKTNAEAYQVATEDELTDAVNPETGQNYSSVEAKVEAMRQSQEMDKYNAQVADAQLTLHSEAERVISDFPLFNPDSEQFDKELAEEAAGLLEANLIYDENTEQIIGSNVSPYKLYQTLAKAQGISTVKGQIKGQQATEKQLANADNANSAAPPQKPKDPLADLWSGDL